MSHVDPRDAERLRRWRLVLGPATEPELPALGSPDEALDRALDELYDAAPDGGLAGSAPEVTRWLGDIRTFFPTSVVRVLQRDALDRLGLRQLLLEPELLAELTPDVHLVATLLALAEVIPTQTRDTARAVIRQVVDEVERQLAEPLRQAVRGALSRSLRNPRPRLREIDWPRTVHANLRHYQPARKTVIPARLVGFGRRQPRLKDVIVAVDQSGSMAESVVYAAIFGAVLASLSAVSTRLIVFDTAVVDLTDQLADPVDVLFGVQLGGGTDISAAVDYCAGLVERPADTVLVLISDLFEGGSRDRLVARVAMLRDAGVRLVVLLALSHSGRPAYDHALAAELAGLDVPAFACTPDHFPGLLAAALAGHDLQAWAAAQNLI